MGSPFYVTTPIYYVNDVPHIGHAYTTVAADALARWRRLWGDEVVFLTGTDEHGLKIQRAAEEHGVTPREWADKTSERFRETWELLDITNTDFIRTTEPRHKMAVQKFLQRVYDNGFIELNTYEGLYCVACEAYYADDEISDGNCPVHKRPIERVREDNYFFKLSEFQNRLLQHYTDHPEAVQPESRRNEVLGFIKGGLRDFSMSRTSISWGIPLPWDESHVAYVWFDALFNYCTAVGYGTDEAQFNKYWPVNYHLVGKDILRFHAVFWPAMLMAAGEAPPQCVFAHGFLLVGGEKMSKTALNQIAPADLVKQFGVDGFRYHFLADQRFGPDGDFSFESMVSRYNADLANNYGNLAQRVLAMTERYCGGETPAARADGPLKSAAEQAFTAVVENFASLDFPEVSAAIARLIGAANAYIEEQEPWKLYKSEETEKVFTVLGDCLETLRIVALLALPIIPNASTELWRRLGLDTDINQERFPEAAQWGRGPSGTQVISGDPLFPRLEVS